MTRRKSVSLHSAYAEQFDDPKIRQRYATQIAERLIATRKALGLNQTQLCRRAGILQSTWSNYEAAARSARDGKERLINIIQLEWAFRLIDTFDLTLDWIYRGDASGLRHSLREKLPEELIF